MYNLLICSRNLSFIKSFFDIIPNNNYYFRILNIAVNYNEIKKYIRCGFIDGIIIDDYNCNIFLNRVLEIIGNENIYPFPQIIYYTKSINNTMNGNDLFDIIHIKPQENEQLNFATLKSLLKSKNIEQDEIMEKKVCNELLKYGFKLSHKGTNYIIKTIIMLKKTNNEEFYYNLEKNVYSIISKENNTSVENVKSNILKSISYAYKNKKKPKPKDLFYSIIDAT